MGGSFLGFILEFLVAALLLATIVYCLIVNQKLDKLRKDQGHLKEIIKDLKHSTMSAETASLELRGAVDKANKDLGEKIDQAEKLNDQLGKQNESSENLVTKLTMIGRALQKKMQEQREEAEAREIQMRESLGRELQNRMAAMQQFPALPMGQTYAMGVSAPVFDNRMSSQFSQTPQIAGFQPQHTPFYQAMPHSMQHPLQPQLQPSMQGQAPHGVAMHMTHTQSHSPGASLQGAAAQQTMQAPLMPPVLNLQAQPIAQTASQAMSQPMSQPQAQNQMQMAVQQPQSQPQASNGQSAPQQQAQMQPQLQQPMPVLVPQPPEGLQSSKKPGAMPQLRLSALSAQNAS